MNLDLTINKVIKNIRVVSKEQAEKDYLKLCNEKDLSLLSIIGNKALDYFFFQYRLKTKTDKKNLSFIDWLELKKKSGFTNSEIRLLDYGINDFRKGERYEIALFKCFGMYNGYVTSFKPIIARNLYRRYNPKCILDFSSGWGGRCLAAMSLNIDYIGFDTNKNLKKAYNDMLELFKCSSTNKIYFEDSSKADLSKFKYDFIFTSPPYYKKNKLVETYEHMPTYKNKEDFNENFLFIVIKNSFLHLEKGGHLCLNIPEYQYEDILPILGKETDKIELVKVARSTTNYKEYIYIWKKNV